MFDPLKTKTRLILYAAGAFALGLGGASVMGWTSLSAMPAIQQAPQVSDAAVRPALDLSDSFVNVSETVTPAVVRIEADRARTVANLQDQIPGLPEQFRRFFDLPPGAEVEPQQEQEPQIQTAGGSGFIVSADGYILTNDHVVSGATQIRVFLSDQRQYNAEVVGTDPTTDVAVIKVDGQGFPTISLGTSADVRVGEWVLAIGNPGFAGRGGSALDYTVTAGIVSAKGRPLQLLSQELENQGWREPGVAIEDFIQTDAVINPGNSGGPLVNMRGQVVGINSAIASPTGYFQGYGFAIPIELAGRVMEDLIEYGEVRRARLGISMGGVDLADAEFYGLPSPTGALVQTVVEGGPAEAAGLRQEDVIVAVDGEPVNYSAQLQSIIAQKRPGDRVTIAYYRDGARRETTVRLDQSALTQQAPAVAEAAPAVEERLGIEVSALDAELAAEIGYDSPGGVVITNLNPNGPAARAGVRPGNRIVAINREPVETVDEAQERLDALESGDVLSLRLGTPTGDTRVVNLFVPE